VQIEIDRAAEILRAGGLVAFPTETVYGLGADATNRTALRRLFAVKRRPSSHPLIVHLADASWLDRWACEVSDDAHRLARHFWPGPLTLVLRRAPGVPDEVTGGQDTVGLRVPAHPIAHALLVSLGRGIAAPSANRFGAVSPTRADHVRADLGSDVDLVLDGGPSEVGIESTIVDVSGLRPALLRPGWITASAIEAALGAPLDVAGTGRPRAPGRLEAHYAPDTPVEVAPKRDLLSRVQSARHAAVLAFDPLDDAIAVAAFRQASRDPAAYAHALYADLRDLDRIGADVILVEQPPDGLEWAGVRDRLKRASHGTARGPARGSEQPEHDR
jgi:L-threonylcarbamoyladenylate synthase